MESNSGGVVRCLGKKVHQKVLGSNEGPCEAFVSFRREIYTFYGEGVYDKLFGEKGRQRDPM